MVIAGVALGRARSGITCEIAFHPRRGCPMADCVLGLTIAAVAGLAQLYSP
jgi:hypothetical protein